MELAWMCRHPAGGGEGIASIGRLGVDIIKNRRSTAPSAAAGRAGRL